MVGWQGMWNIYAGRWTGGGWPGGRQAGRQVGQSRTGCKWNEIILKF